MSATPLFLCRGPVSGMLRILVKIVLFSLFILCLKIETFLTFLLCA